MKRSGFTLVELLGIITVLGIIALIATPVVQKTINNNRERMFNVIKNQLVDVAKDWSAKNTSFLPKDQGDYINVSFEELKKEGLLRMNVINPTNDNIFSNQSFVRITKKNNNFDYEVITYDLIDADKVEAGAPVITLNGSQVLYIGIGDTYEEYGIVEELDASIQIVKNGQEFSTVDTSEDGIYSVYYSCLKNGKLGVNIRTVIVK